MSNGGSRTLGGLVLAAMVAGLAVDAVPRQALAAEPVRCLTRDEQRAAIVNGQAVPLASAVRALHRPPLTPPAPVVSQPHLSRYVPTARRGRV